MKPYYSAPGVTLYLGDCLDVLPRLKAADACVSDPPYGLTGASRNGSPRTNDPQTPFGRHNLQPRGFMGLQWDGAIPGVEFWRAISRAVRPCGYQLTMGGTRTYHRLACAVEDAGWEVRDCLMWLYGSGFPKGRGCLKPAWEPILLARNPGRGVLPLGIDECRVPGAACSGGPNTGRRFADGQGGFTEHQRTEEHPAGRWPANVVHDGSAEVLEAFAAFGERPTSVGRLKRTKSIGYGGSESGPTGEGYGDTGTAARFFYTAKAGKRDRGDGNNHPTVKPTSLMRWLVQLICPPAGLCLDPFTGSGTTGVACLQTGRKFIGIELSEPYCEIAAKRLEAAAREGVPA